MIILKLLGGEQLLWTANFAAGLCAYHAAPVKALKALWLPTLVSGLGYLGILFVLMQATRGLEKRQLKEYGGSETFESWRDRTWPGLSLSLEEAAEEEAGGEEDPVE